MNKVIEINNLKKSYKDILAVEDLSLDIIKGEMFGLVGPDGAGKTTTLRILCGLLKAQSGKIKILNKELNENVKEIQKEIGYLSQKYSLYGDLTIDENIEFFAQIHNITKFEKKREELLEFTRLKPFRERLADKLSGGMRQKLALACSLIHQPKILFLDEPTTGVDPVSRRDFWKILSNLIRDGLTVIMTTPYLDEAERCNRVAMMNEGKLIIIDTPQEIKRSLNKGVIEIVCNPIREAYRILQKKGFKSQMFGDRLNLVVDANRCDGPNISLLLTNNNIMVEDIREITPTLENVFIHLIEEEN